MTSHDIIDALALKHASDVFVPECKDGPSAGTSHFRMDAWVMTKSWTNMRTIGYEVKVSRSDYQGDKKWPAYLDYCNEFYFVTPAKLIQPEEVPDPAGLMWVASTGNRVYTKKRAEVRPANIPETVYQYILMCRATITRHEWSPGDKSSRMESLEAWVTEKQKRDSLHHRVGERIKQRQAALEEENRRLKAETERLAEFKAELVRCGIDTDDLYGRYTQQRIINEQFTGKAKTELTGLRELVRAGERLLKALEPEAA